MAKLVDNPRLVDSEKALGERGEKNFENFKNTNKMAYKLKCTSANGKTICYFVYTIAQESDPSV
jgi:hypothetical protein